MKVINFSSKSVKLANSVAWMCLAIGLLVMAGCGKQGQGPAARRDTPTSGTVHIAVDSTLQPVVSLLIEAFEKRYPKARIIAHYAPEAAAVKYFLAGYDSVRLFVGTRQLTEAELGSFRERSISPHVSRIAQDGVVMLLNPARPDSISYAQMLDIFSGRARTWQHVHRNLGPDSLLLVFENGASSTRSFLADSVLARTGASFRTSQVYAAGSAQGVINYVAQSRDAIGFLGYNMISDTRDTAVQSNLGRVKIAKLQNTDLNAPPAHKYIYLPAYPHYYLWSGSYPLRRNVYITRREPRHGLGTGFESFVVADEGQMVVHHLNMVAPYLNLQFELRQVEIRQGSVDD